MGEKLNQVGNKLVKGIERHPYVASAIYVIGASALTIGLYKYFGKIVAKEVVKALI